MKYLTVWAQLNSTAIRNHYDGKNWTPEELLLSSDVITAIKKWQLDYEAEHYRGFKNEKIIKALDRRGLEICEMIKKQLKDVKVEYFSEALGKVLHWMS